MEWISCLRETIRYIEDNLRDELDIARISDHVYISAFHLQRGFQIMTGYTIGEYIRGRRLYQAALDIVRTDAKIIDVALDYGYDTPESFAKAFSRFHGCTPSQVRTDLSRIRRFLPLQIHVSITGGDKMDYKVSPMFGFKLIGFERTFTMESAYAEIPRFWDEICEKYCANIYAGNPPANAYEKAVMDNCIGEFGVCIDDLGGERFRYLIAGRYAGGEVPEGMKLVEFPAGEWVKFGCTGPMPDALQTLNTKIFREWLPGNTEFEMTGCYNIEWYSCDGNKDDADYQSGIWLPVKRR